MIPVPYCRSGFKLFGWIRMMFSDPISDPEPNILNCLENCRIVWSLNVKFGNLFNFLSLYRNGTRVSPTMSPDPELINSALHNCYEQCLNPGQQINSLNLLKAREGHHFIFTWQHLSYRILKTLASTSVSDPDWIRIQGSSWSGSRGLKKVKIVKNHTLILLFSDFYNILFTF